MGAVFLIFKNGKKAALHVGDAGAAFFGLRMSGKRHLQHPAGVWGDALHAGDAGAAFLVWESCEKRQLSHPSFAGVMLQVPGVMLCPAGDAGAAFLVLEKRISSFASIVLQVC